MEQIEAEDFPDLTINDNKSDPSGRPNYDTCIEGVKQINKTFPDLTMGNTAGTPSYEIKCDEGNQVEDEDFLGLIMNAEKETISGQRKCHTDMVEEQMQGRDILGSTMNVDTTSGQINYDLSIEEGKQKEVEDCPGLAINDDKSDLSDLNDKINVDPCMEGEYTQAEDIPDVTMKSIKEGKQVEVKDIPGLTMNDYVGTTNDKTNSDPCFEERDYGEAQDCTGLTKNDNIMDTTSGKMDSDQCMEEGACGEAKDYTGLTKNDNIMDTTSAKINSDVCFEKGDYGEYTSLIMNYKVMNYKIMDTTSGKMNCDQCVEEGEEIEAEGYCKSCSDFLCAACYRIHLRPKPWRNHQLVNKDHMARFRTKKTGQDGMANDIQGKNVDLETAPDSIKDGKERCKDHSDKLVEYYCKAHKLLGCSVCMTLNHRLCNIVYLPNDPSQLADILEYTALETEMAKLHGQLEESLTKTEGFKTQIEEMSDKVLSDGESFIKKVIIEIEKNQRKLIAKANKDIKKIDGFLENYKLVETALRETREDIKEKVQNKSNIRQVYEGVRHGYDAVRECQHKLDILNQKNTGIVPFKFQPSESLLNMVKTENKTFGLSASGNVESDIKSDLLQNLKADISENTLTRADGKSNEKQAAAKSLKSIEKSDLPLKAELTEVAKQALPKPATEAARLADAVGEYTCTSKINLRSESDKKTCAITGMAMLKTNKMALCDFDNVSLKVIDVNNLTSNFLQKRLNSAPYEAVFTGKALVITQPIMGKLAIFDDASTFKSYKHISVGGECRGIAYHEEKLFISFQTNPGKIQVRKISGEILKIFTTVGGDSFHHPCHLAVHPSLPKLYISDWQISVLGFDGSLVRKHRDIGFNELRGLTVDDNGDIYVCDKGSNLVYLVSPMVATKQVVLSEKQGVKDPSCLLLIGMKKKKLFVGMDNSDFIKVFQK